MANHQVHRHQLDLILLRDRYAVVRLDRDADIPSWAIEGGLFSITRTNEELSVVCSQSAVPEGVTSERGWRCFRVARQIAFSVVGVLASLTEPLAKAGVSVFAISTFDTDYLMVNEHTLDRAMEALRQYGHTIRGEDAEQPSKDGGH